MNYNIKYEQYEQPKKTVVNNEFRPQPATKSEIHLNMAMSLQRRNT